MLEASAQELLKSVDRRQEALAAALAGSYRSQFGQFFTPASTARLIASMLNASSGGSVRLLDPGAGFGILTAAAVIQLASQSKRPKSVEVVAYEIDRGLAGDLRQTLTECGQWARSAGTNLSWELRSTDYVIDAATIAKEGHAELFDAVIMNPPYRKIRNDSEERAALEATGLRVANLYTAFLALAATNLRPGGIIAAITPRSFANGLYHEPFRQFFFDLIGIERIHLFESRSEVFANADVLQENIVFAGRRDRKPVSTKLSIGYATRHGKPRPRDVPYAEIIQPGDRQQFLRIPTEEDDASIALTMASLPATAADLGVKVSTGRVVDFRAKKYLRQRPSSYTAPLIYPCHMRDGVVVWPNSNGNRKPNALKRCPATSNLLLPSGTYVLVKRFTSKEERRRVVAAVMTPADVQCDAVAIENHLNVYHDKGCGLQPHLAYGLAAYLNSNFVDRYVRQFSGHTQINAADLRHLRYPSYRQLSLLGRSLRNRWPDSQMDLDRIVASVLAEADENSSASDMASGVAA